MKCDDSHEDAMVRALVYVAEKGIRSSFNMVHAALGPRDKFGSDVCFID